MIQSRKANHQGDDTNPQGGWGAGALKAHSLLFYYGIYNAFEVDAFGPYNFGSKGLQGF